MNCLILCNGNVATKPYHFELTDCNVYTIEELCYYIYNNIYTIDISCFDKELADWIGNQLGLDILANKLNKLVEEGNGLKDVVVTIMCGCDYYNEEEINQLIHIIDEIEGMGRAMKAKIKADNYLKYNYYSKAAREYAAILGGSLKDELTSEEMGNILHNIGIVRLHTSSFLHAAESFKEAYIRNNNIESLKSYLFALKMENCDEEFEFESLNYSIPKEQAKTIANEYLLVNEEAKMSEHYLKVIKIERQRDEGRIAEFNQSVDQYLAELKMDYIEKRAMEK